MSKVTETGATSNHEKSKRKLKNSSSRPKSGRPTGLDKLERKVKILEYENAALAHLYNQKLEQSKEDQQLYNEAVQTWKKAAEACEKTSNLWKDAYYMLLDILKEDGLTPEDYVSSKELAVRFSSKYRLN